MVGERAEYAGQRRLLPERHESVRLDPVEAVDLGAGLDVVGIGDVYVDPDRQIGPRCRRFEDPDYRRIVPLVDDPVERDVT